MLEGESEYFGGSSIKTRMAMVMSVQVKLKRLWEQQAAASPRRRRVNAGDPPENDELMNLAEFVDVVRFMGFDATLERAADIVEVRLYPLLCWDSS